MTTHTPGPRFWMAHAQAQCKSGLSRAEYCRQHDLSYHSLTYWQRKLKKQPISPGSQLVPVPEKTIQAALSPKKGDKRVVLPNSITVGLSNIFSCSALTRLLSILESR